MSLGKICGKFIMLFWNLLPTLFIFIYFLHFLSLLPSNTVLFMFFLMLPFFLVYLLNLFMSACWVHVENLLYYISCFSAKWYSYICSSVFFLCIFFQAHLPGQNILEIKCIIYISWQHTHKCKCTIFHCCQVGLELTPVETMVFHPPHSWYNSGVRSMSHTHYLCPLVDDNLF